jgi:hypothetical protein
MLFWVEPQGLWKVLQTKWSNRFFGQALLTEHQAKNDEQDTRNLSQDQE